MFKKLMAVFIIFGCIATLLTGCAKSADDASEGSRGEMSVLTVPELRTAIEDILTSASKGSGNTLAVIGGFSDKLDAIKTESDAIKDKSDGIYKKIAPDEPVVVENLQNIRAALDEKLSVVKEAKNERDIDKLKTALDALLVEIEAYGAYLDTIATNMEASA